MAFAQKSYNQILGHPGNETIADAGCFLTAICNLELAYGKEIAPPDLNQYFIDHNDYLPEGNLKDLLSWHSVSQYDPITQIIQTIDHGTQQTAGWPNTDQAIVRFYYRSISHPTLPNGQPNMIWHFCKVADPINHLILDSWDGMVKKSPYGEPTAWASYGRTTPVAVVVNPTPPPAPAPTPPPAPAPAPKTYQVLKTIPGYPNSNDAANHINPSDTVPAGNYTVFNEAHGMVNVTTKPGTPGSWINPADNTAYSSTVIQGAYQVDKPTYQLKNTVMGFSTANDAVNKRNAKNTVSPMKYYVYNTRYGMLNLTKNPGSPGSWIDPADDVPAPEPPVAAAPVPPAPSPTVQTPPEPAYKPVMTSLQSNGKPLKYVMLFDYTAKDYSGKMEPDTIHIPKGTELQFYGTFKTPDGAKVWRPRLQRDQHFDYWIGIPMTATINGIPEILFEEQQQLLTQADLDYNSHSTISHDYGRAVAIAEKIDTGIKSAAKVIDGFIKPRRK